MGAGKEGRRGKRRGGGRKGRGRKNREEKEISVECPSERGQCQRERESIKPCLWFLKTIIRENKKEDHSKVSSLGDHKNELIGRYHRASKWRCQGGWLCGCRRVRLPRKMQTVREGQSKGSINVYGTCGSVNEGKGEKRRKPDQRHKKEARALKHTSAPNPCLQGTFRLSHLQPATPAPPNLTFDAFTTPDFSYTVLTV